LTERRNWFLAGLFCTTFATLAVEIIDTRLLSVASWYHLSFFAVSTAMFGMAAGAVRVYLAEEEFSGAAAAPALARYAMLLAIAIPASHLANLCIPIPPGTGMPTVVATAITCVVLAIPFYLSGIAVAIALTRVPGPSGLIYGVDLLGAALGAIGVFALFELSSIVSAMLVVGAIAALGAFCFHRFAGGSGTGLALALLSGLLLLATVNDVAESGVRPFFVKGRYRPPSMNDFEFWTVHGLIDVRREQSGKAFFWSAGANAVAPNVRSRRLLIDGLADTQMTAWSGDPGELDWIQGDLTSLPYHLRKGGNNGVIGVGGGRDILTALWGQSDSVLGIEVNEAFVHLLEGPLREFAHIADDPRVTLVHDEARSYLTRTDARFDVLQMALIDTWAATGAGAFTLSENGLYTVEAWTTFLETLKPGGLFSVSRWYSKDRASETSRVLALATASLLELGVQAPERHIALAARRNLATLIVSNEPLREHDIATLAGMQRGFGLKILLAPGHTSPVPLLQKIATSRSAREIEMAVAHPHLDYSPPTDEQPYFFNILKPAGFFADVPAQQGSPGILFAGNLRATHTLMILWIVTFVLVLATIIGPLARSGLPNMPAGEFGLAISYFALIGMGFMFVQIPLMQRFSVYLGHPTYSLSVILFSMILAVGAGSMISDRLPVEANGRWVSALPLAVGANLLTWTLAIPSIVDATVELELPSRIAITVGVVSLIALPLGFFFPMGLRLVRRLSNDAMPWMWGINGAAGVLATVSAVGISMWSGVSTGLFLATTCYAVLWIPAVGIWRCGETRAREGNAR